MPWFRLPWSGRGQFIAGTAIVAIFAVGCPDAGVTGISSDGYGTVVNTNKSGDLIGGVRLRDQGEVYSFGTFRSDGNVDEINAIVFNDPNGQLSTLYLESGRPARAVLADGSRFQITYDEVSTQRLKGNVTFSPASGGSQTLAFDIDLQKTAQDIAQIIQQTTGIQITTQSPPADATTGKARHDSSRTAVEATVVIGVPVILVVTGFTINLIVSQLLQAVINLATAIAKSILVAILTPFVFMGNLLRLATGQPLVRLDYNMQHVEQGDVILTIPRPQPF